MALAPHTGRQHAHDIAYAACRSATEAGEPLAVALSRRPGITALLDAAAIARLTDPVHYLGLAPQMVDQALARSAAQG